MEKITVSTILEELTPKDISSMSLAELKKVTNVLNSAANKRLKRLEAAGETSGVAYRFAMVDTNGKFSTKGKNLNELRAEFKRAYRFFNLKSSSLTQAKKERKTFEIRFKEHTGHEASDFTKEEINSYYEMIGKFRELYPDKNFKYDEKVLARMIKENSSEEDIIEAMHKSAKENYEKLAEEDYFEGVTDWEELPFD